MRHFISVLDPILSPDRSPPGGDRSKFKLRFVPMFYVREVLQHTNTIGDQKCFQRGNMRSDGAGAESNVSYKQL
jgi:hypothetical protein